VLVFSESGRALTLTPAHSIIIHPIIISCSIFGIFQQSIQGSHRVKQAKSILHVFESNFVIWLLPVSYVVLLTFQISRVVRWVRFISQYCRGIMDKKLYCTAVAEMCANVH
jgi:hypothetical protein